MAHEAFVSYSHHDKPQADAVCATLESKGIRCWIAPRDVIPGQEWGAAIVDAIRSSRVMVLVFSSHANSSPQIRREVQLAVSAETVLIPFRIEDVAPAQSLEYFLGTPHWLDALTPPLEAHLERLTAAVMSFLALGEPDGSTASTATSPESNSATDADLTQTASPRGREPRTEEREATAESTGAGGITRPDRAFTLSEESDGAAAKIVPATEMVSRPASVPPTETSPTEQVLDGRSTGAEDIATIDTTQSRFDTSPPSATAAEKMTIPSPGGQDKTVERRTSRMSSQEDAAAPERSAAAGARAITPFAITSGIGLIALLLGFVLVIRLAWTLGVVLLLIGLTGLTFRLVQKSLKRD
jgi:hypothetical protein